jgi:hypothetical protein
MEMSMKVNGLVIKQMVMVNILILTELNIQENGRMINNMVMEFKNGWMVKDIKVNIEMELKQGKVLSNF